MSEFNRWSIAELQAKYLLEPRLNDVFVEGVYDKEILTVACLEAGRNYSIYEIDLVDVPAELLIDYGLTSGNKQRVIALANELKMLGDDVWVQCLVDRDLDHWLGEVKDDGLLRWTKYCSIESHFLGKGVARDIVLVTGRAKIKNFDVFYDSLVVVLKTLYAMRLADRRLGLNLTWVALKKYLSRDGDKLVLNYGKYVVACLNATSCLSRKDEFIQEADAWLAKLDCDVRFASRGHDYTELLALAVGEFSGDKQLGQEIVERLFVLFAKTADSLLDELRVFE